MDEAGADADPDADSFSTVVGEAVGLQVAALLVASTAYEFLGFAGR
jgi:hypothetical protein